MPFGSITMLATTSRGWRRSRRARERDARQHTWLARLAGFSVEAERDELRRRHRVELGLAVAIEVAGRERRERAADVERAELPELGAGA